MSSKFPSGTFCIVSKADANLALDATRGVGKGGPVVLAKSDLSSKFQQWEFTFDHQKTSGEDFEKYQYGYIKNGTQNLLVYYYALLLIVLRTCC